MKRATIKDVAKAAGVSVSAVSRAFTDGSVAAETRERIRLAADTLSYRPSRLARGLAQQRSGTVTLVTGHMADPFDVLFLEMLAEELADREIRLVVAPASKQTARGGGVFQAIDDRSDAVIIAAGTMPLEVSDICVRIGLPMILAGRIVEEPGIASIAADNADGGRQAAELFLRTGCRRPMYYGLPRNTFSGHERGAGFAHALTAAGLAVATTRPDGSDDGGAFEGAVRLLSSPGRPDAVFCATDHLAFGVIEAARALGVAIPHELSVIGFNNVPSAARHAYRLTSIDYPIARVVAEITKLIDGWLGDPVRGSVACRIPVSLVIRETTRSASG